MQLKKYAFNHHRTFILFMSIGVCLMTSGCVSCQRSDSLPSQSLYSPSHLRRSSYRLPHPVRLRRPSRIRSGALAQQKKETACGEHSMRMLDEDKAYALINIR
jgi:hypothetical protein